MRQAKSRPRAYVVVRAQAEMSCDGDGDFPRVEAQATGSCGEPAGQDLRTLPRPSGKILSRGASASASRKPEIDGGERAGRLMYRVQCAQRPIRPIRSFATHGDCDFGCARPFALRFAGGSN